MYNGWEQQVKKFIYVPLWWEVKESSVGTIHISLLYSRNIL